MNKDSVLTRQIGPFKQAVIVYLGIIIFTLIFFGMSKMGINCYEAHTPWMMSAAGILFFALFNTVFSLSSRSQNRYWLHSILAFATLMIVTSLTSWFISGQSLDEAKTIRWLYKVFTIGYLVFLSIVRLMRKVVQIALREDSRMRGED